jgi:hypothetical protein
VGKKRGTGIIGIKEKSTLLRCAPYRFIKGFGSTDGRRQTANIFIYGGELESL